MSRPAPFVCVLLCVVATACGGDPNIRTADWEENFNGANKATAAGEHDRAIAIADAFLKKHPDNVDGHLMLGSALLEAGKAASDATRPARLELAAKHYARALELTNNSIFRVVAIGSLVELYSVRGLNNRDEAIRYARMFITNTPSDITSYYAAITLLTEAKKYDEVVAVLAQAKGAIEPQADAWARYGGIVHDLVALSPDFPRETGRTLLAETAALIEQSLSKYGRTENLLRTKGMVLRAQAGVEPDRARQRALGHESQPTFDELDRLEKK
jgi:tetratricopeptide (TPR) repeat protein